MKINDFVTGIEGSPYSITTDKITRGKIIDLDNNKIKVKVLDHSENRGLLETFWVDPKLFRVIGHAKEFNREDVLELLRNGCKKAILDYDLTEADLRRADLTGANLDFSCWPLWFGSLHVKADVRHARQLAYHLCSMQCEDDEYIKMRNSILSFANKFHRMEECGELNPREIQEDSNV